MLAGAIAGACRVLQPRLKLLASHMLEAAEAELEMYDERVYLRSEPSKGKTFAEVACAAHSFRLSFPSDERYPSGLVAQYR
jgi:Molybdopterin-binding domain of aldehyde dehydrogenase